MASAQGGSALGGEWLLFLVAYVLRIYSKK